MQVMLNPSVVFSYKIRAMTVWRAYAFHLLKNLFVLRLGKNELWLTLIFDVDAVIIRGQGEQWSQQWEDQAFMFAWTKTLCQLGYVPSLLWEIV